MQPMQLVWLRSDLRLHDNTALSAAAARGPCVAVYLLSPQQWLEHDDAPCKVDFWLRNLRKLSRELGQLNIPLLIRQASHWDDAPNVLLNLCREWQVDALYLNEEYGVHEARRDASVARTLRAEGIEVRRYLDQLLFKPGSVLTQSGTYFQVFSQFRKVCYERLHHSLPGLVRAPLKQAPLNIPGDQVPSAVDGFATPADSLRNLWAAGEDEARRRLDSFSDAQIEHYQNERDFPAKPGTSQLSAYLAAGVISPRQCLHAALHSNQGEFESGKPGAVTWINELLWREFYKHILVGYPRVSRHRAFRPETEALAWRNAPDELAAWQQARTGLPIIDAAMRQLLATGWMHNRLRMVVAMFLTKNLLIDWREGERFFMRHLIDGDLAANNGGWQWSSSTGTDSAPYFRIFNPLSQSEKFDPEGLFIKHWLPELAGLNKKDVHNPANLGGLFGAVDYPSPIVDLSASRTRALSAFKNLPSRLLLAESAGGPMSSFLRQFAGQFMALDKDNLQRLADLYTHDVHFTDPLHDVQGLGHLHDYFAGLYANVSELHFDFHGFDQVSEGEGYLRWVMRYRHPRLAGGRPIQVAGCSHLLWRDKVYRHRDYFDAAALLYEHVPVLGRTIAWLKRRLG